MAAQKAKITEREPWCEREDEGLRKDKVGMEMTDYVT